MGSICIYYSIYPYLLYMSINYRNKKEHFNDNFGPPHFLLFSHGNSSSVQFHHSIKLNFIYTPCSIVVVVVVLAFVVCR